MAQRILIVDGHPDSDRGRLCHALVDAYVEGAMEAGKETRLITIADAPIEFLRTARDFDAPAASEAIKSAQADLIWADHLVLIFPLWLGGAPALLHAFLEQVARGKFFAETSGPGIQSRFKGKSARVVVTMGMPAIVYRLIFQAHGVRSIMQGVLGFAGYGPVRATFLGAIEAISAARLQSHLAKMRMLGREGR